MPCSWPRTALTTPLRMYSCGVVGSSSAISLFASVMSSVKHKTETINLQHQSQQHSSDWTVIDQFHIMVQLQHATSINADQNWGWVQTDQSSTRVIPSQYDKSFVWNLLPLEACEMYANCGKSCSVNSEIALMLAIIK